MKLSVVLPVFNEKDLVAITCEGLIEVLSRNGVDFELVVVNDGSQDGSQEAIDRMCQSHPQVIRSITHPYNKGNGAAVKTGIKNARGEWIACMDADGQHDPEDLIRMLAEMDRFDMVVGARPADRDAEWFRTVANRFYNWLASSLTQFKIQDLTSGFRVFRSDVIKKFVNLFPQRFSYPTTSTLALIKSGYSICYVPIHIQPRQAGRSKIHLFRDGWRFTMIILKIVILFEPMRVFLPVSGISFLLALVSSILSTAMEERLRVPNSSVVLFVLGILSLLLGMIAEQLAAIQINVIENEKPGR